MPNNPNTLQHRALENQMIQLEGVSRRFHDGHQDILALREVDLEVPQGQIMAILGRSGSGKSTLLHLIAGLDVPDQGRIRVGSTEVQTLTEDRRTAFRLKHIGFVFQFFHLLPGLTAQENVMFPAELAGHPRKEAKARALDLLESVQLGPRASTYADRLSGGEQQRVAVARSLMLRPSVLLADEPTGNLDSETGDHVVELMFRLAREQGFTLILATHSADLARQADRRIEVRDGRIFSDSAPAKAAQ
jgi:putative ABC transport system ATP-binding protein